MAPKWFPRSNSTKTNLAQGSRAPRPMAKQVSPDKLWPELAALHPSLQEKLARYPGSYLVILKEGLPNSNLSKFNRTLIITTKSGNKISNSMRSKDSTGDANSRLLSQMTSLLLRWAARFNLKIILEGLGTLRILIPTRNEVADSKLFRARIKIHSRFSRHYLPTLSTLKV